MRVNVLLAALSLLCAVRVIGIRDVVGLEEGAALEEDRSSSDVQGNATKRVEEEGQYRHMCGAEMSTLINAVCKCGGGEKRDESKVMKGDKRCEWKRGEIEMRDISYTPPSVDAPTACEMSEIPDSGKPEYILKIQTGAKSTGFNMAQHGLSVATAAVSIGLGVINPILGKVAGLIMKEVAGLFGKKQKQETMHIDLEEYFDRFESYLEEKDLRKVLEHIKNQYLIFAEWFETLNDPRTAPVAPAFVERKVEIMETHADLARAVFMTELRSAEVRDGRVAFYLFEPAFNQAMAHLQLMMLHTVYYAALGASEDSKVGLSRAKLKYDEYRALLTEQGARALDWRMSHITGPRDERLVSKPVTSRTLCSVRAESKEHTGGANLEEPKFAYKRSYTWKDSFPAEAIEERAKTKISKWRHDQGNYVSSISCIMRGDMEESDTEREPGEAMAERAGHYRDQVERLTSDFVSDRVKALDNFWVDFPRCLPTYLRQEELRGKDKSLLCKTVASPSLDPDPLSLIIREYWGPIVDDDGHWPGGKPAFSPELYYMCKKPSAVPAKEKEKWQTGLPPIPPDSQGVCVQLVGIKLK